MIILDENILEDQRQLLLSWRLGARHIGHDLGRKGLPDEEIVPFLYTLRRSTFFTRDQGFYQQGLGHSRYCLVCMAVGPSDVATYVRRLLRHQEFDTEAKRLGTVVRLSSRGITVWRLHAEQEVHFSW